MGRSAIEYISTIATQDALTHQVLLIGSKRSQLSLGNFNFEILEPSSAFNQIKKGGIFYNAAFLRREFLHKMNVNEYIQINTDITDFAKRALQEKQLKCFINLSSGVARDFDVNLDLRIENVYSYLKKLYEEEFLVYCSEANTRFVNCRIYSLSGKYINEFHNLALSSFISQAISERRIYVESPMTSRTYLDSVDLAQILLKKAMQDEDIFFDTGGNLVTMLELAETIKKVLGDKDLEIYKGNLESPNYFGDYKRFDSLISHLNIQLTALDQQIVKTLEAFKN